MIRDEGVARMNVVPKGLSHGAYDFGQGAHVQRQHDVFADDISDRIE
jgi:hypothetical protein